MASAKKSGKKESVWVRPEKQKVIGENKQARQPVRQSKQVKAPAQSPKTDAPKKKKSVVGKIFLFGLLIIIAGLLLFCGAQSRILKVEYIDYWSRELPSGFNNFKILYISDINAISDSDLSDKMGLMGDLNKLSPHAIIIGGDIAADSYISDAMYKLGLFNPSDSARVRLERTQKLLNTVAGISAPAGVYIVPGEESGDLWGLEDACKELKFNYLDGVSTKIINGPDSLYLIGLNPLSKDTAELINPQEIGVNDVTVTVCHDPNWVKEIVAEKGDLMDLVLSGHTLGGEFTAFGVSLINMGEYPSGSHVVRTTDLVVSPGVGTKSGLRFGSQPTVYLITLKKTVG